ncbi:MAG: hypothetical protein SWX82_21880 [Cyanobacteriota bacterium]|nr:hypothetical protein [Cyanobacteriota bacterium]
MPGIPFCGIPLRERTTNLGFAEKSRVWEVWEVWEVWRVWEVWGERESRRNNCTCIKCRIIKV